MCASPVTQSCWQQLAGEGLLLRVLAFAPGPAAFEIGQQQWCVQKARALKAVDCQLAASQ